MFKSLCEQGQDNRLGASRFAWGEPTCKSHQLALGKAADLVVIHGDPSVKIADIENTEIVFKDGVGYDSAKLINSVKGLVGLR